ncbi:hypothetical protein STRTUCAR8_05395, partial [Streptomyces turgidiscabies Car8]
GVSETCTPFSAASGSALARVRFHARTVWPDRARLRAMAAPMMPVPSTATERAGVSMSVMGSVKQVDGVLPSGESIHQNSARWIKY